MPRCLFNSLLTLIFSLAVLSGCATPLPPTYSAGGADRVLDGPVLALAGEGDLVAAVNNDGLFVKDGDGPWVSQEVPGMLKWRQVTCLLVNDGVIYLGSDGEGLFIFSEGTWEVRTSRYGGLPDDGVLSMAIDGNEEGLPGKSLWVGTRKGVAAYREDNWTEYRPGEDWLVAMTGKSGSGAGKVYVSPGFKLGQRGGDSDRFRPPVTAISVGPDRVVFGNRRSGLAVVDHNAVATFNFNEEVKFTYFEVDRDVIWAGTEAGLLWGGRKGGAEGKPWPTYHSYMGWSGTLFSSRDTRDMEYRWKMVGYNAAKVVGLERRGSDVWVAHRSEGGANLDRSRRPDIDPKQLSYDSITDVRRYVNIDEYIARRQKIMHESYGMSTGIKGSPSALYVTPDSSKVWIGTTKGLWELSQ